MAAFDTQNSMGRTDFIERSPLTRDALAFAADRHAGQTRDIDGIPFVTHPVEVACLLHEAGYSDEVVAAGVLHDVVEDTNVQPEELARLGKLVGRLGVDHLGLGIGEEPFSKADLARTLNADGTQIGEAVHHQHVHRSGGA